MIKFYNILYAPQIAIMLILRQSKTSNKGDFKLHIKKRTEIPNYPRQLKSTPGNEVELK